MSECESCGKEPISDIGEYVSEVFRLQTDMFMYGFVTQCNECGRRMEPPEKDEIIEHEEEKFLEKESLNHGME